MKNKVVSCRETIYPFPVTLSIQQAEPAHEVNTMKSVYKKILALLLVCALPTLSIAESTTKPAEQPALAITAPAVTPQIAPQALPQAAILIGYVDLIRVSTESETGKAGQAKLTAKKDKLQNQIESKRKQLDKQRAAIEAKLPTLNQKQRESKAKEFQKKVAEYQKYVQKADNELQELQQELSRTLFEKIEQAAAEYAKNNGLTLVTVKRDLVYLAGNVIPQDVTEGVVKLINEKGRQKK